MYACVGVRRGIILDLLKGNVINFSLCLNHSETFLWLGKIIFYMNLKKFLILSILVGWRKWQLEILSAPTFLLRVASWVFFSQFVGVIALLSLCHFPPHALLSCSSYPILAPIHPMRKVRQVVPTWKIFLTFMQPLLEAGLESCILIPIQDF